MAATASAPAAPRPAAAPTRHVPRIADLGRLPTEQALLFAIAAGGWEG